MDTISVTVVPASTVVPFAGSVPMTWPSSTLRSNWVRTSPTFTPSACSAARASSSDLPRRSGSGVGGGPLLRTTFTIAPTFTTVPGAGSSDATDPSGASVLNASPPSTGCRLTARSESSTLATSAPGSSAGTTG